MTSPIWISDGSPLPDPHGHGERAVDFIRRLKHPKSVAPGHAFQLAPFQERMLRRVYGDTDANGQRRIKTVLALLPRGARKTSLGASLALLHMIGPERVPGGYAVSVACDREQARISYDEAVGIINMSKPLVAATWVRDSRNLIEHPKSGSRYYAASSDAKAAWGKTPTFALADELHAWYGDTLWRAIRTGMAKSPGSLLWIISTSGAGRENLLWAVSEYGRKVAAGEIVDDGFLPIIFEPGADVDIDAEWRNEDLWHAVNPGLQYGFPDLSGLRQLAREAESRPIDRMAFQQYHLNFWSDSQSAPWIDMRAYDACVADFALDDLDPAARAWVGIDLASVEDLAAVAVLVEREEGGFWATCKFFVPEATLQRRSQRDGIPYDVWHREKFLEATPGNVIDYQLIEDHVKELSEQFRVKGIAIDRWGSTGTQSRLLDEELPVVAHGMGFASMSPACKEVQRLILAGDLRIARNPVLRWNFTNVVIEGNPAGDIKITKTRCRDKVDGCTALAMSCGIATAQSKVPSVYETRAEFLWV